MRRGDPGRDGHDDRVRLRVTLGHRPESEVRAAREAKRAAARARAEARGERAEQAEEDLDAAVAAELRLLAAMDAWDGPPPAPSDPYAPRMVLRLQHEEDRRYLVMGVARRSPSDEEVAVEFRKRLGP